MATVQQLADRLGLAVGEVEEALELYNIPVDGDVIREPDASLILGNSRVGLALRETGK